MSDSIDWKGCALRTEERAEKAEARVAELEAALRLAACRYVDDPPARRRTDCITAEPCAVHALVRSSDSVSHPVGHPGFGENHPYNVDMRAAAQRASEVTPGGRRAPKTIDRTDPRPFCAECGGDGLARDTRYHCSDCNGTGRVLGAVQTDEVTPERATVDRGTATAAEVQAAIATAVASGNGLDITEGGTVCMQIAQRKRRKENEHFPHTGQVWREACDHAATLTSALEEDDPEEVFAHGAAWQARRNVDNLKNGLHPKGCRITHDGRWSCSFGTAGCVVTDHSSNVERDFAALIALHSDYVLAGMMEACRPCWAQSREMALREAEVICREQAKLCARDRDSVAGHECITCADRIRAQRIDSVKPPGDEQ